MLSNRGCDILQIYVIKVICDKLEISATFSDLSMRHKISLELRVKKKLHSYTEKSFFDS